MCVSGAAHVGYVTEREQMTGRGMAGPLGLTVHAGAAPEIKERKRETKECV